MLLLRFGDFERILIFNRENDGNVSAFDSDQDSDDERDDSEMA